MSEFGFPRQNKRQEIGRKGESHFAGFIIEKLGWVYRPVHQESDFGIDGYVDILIDGNVTGKSFAVQIKCGDSYTSKRSAGGIKYEGENKHLNYYLNLNTPIVLIVFTGRCDTGYWVEFDIEKTTSTTNGWWIEIEKSNEINETIRNKWINIAGAPNDYSDGIRQMWAVDEAISSSDYLAFAIPKEDVLNCCMDHILSIIKKLTKNRQLLLSKRNPVEIFFPEYDNDPREVYAIPEIRKWISASIAMGIPWFYFINTKGKATSLKLLLFCACNVEVAEIRSSGHLLVTEAEERTTWLEKNFHNLNLFTELNSISVKINEEVCESIMTCLFPDYPGHDAL